MFSRGLHAQSIPIFIVLIISTLNVTIGVTSSRGSFTFLGLLAFSFAELGFQSSKGRLVDASVAFAGLGVYVLHSCHLALLQS